MRIEGCPDFSERVGGPENPGNSLITDEYVNKIGIYVKIGVFLQILRKYFDFCLHFSKITVIFAADNNIHFYKPYATR